MATTTKTVGVVKPGSQGAKILNALSDQAWCSTSELYRRCGSVILATAISKLKSKGYQIEHRTVTGKERATLRHQYRLVDPPLPLPDPGPVIARDELDRDATPRDASKRFRIYVVNEQNKLLLLATAPTEEQVGVEICRLGREGKMTNACLGLLDSHGVDNKKEKGTWLISPWEPKTI